MSLLPTQFHFLHPQWLWLLAGLPLLLLLIVWQQRRRRSVTQLVDAALLTHVTAGKHAPKSAGYAPLFLATIFWLLACLALAGPSWKQYPQALQNAPSAQVIAAALPTTLKATDMSPNRLAHLRFKIHDLLRANRAGLNGLVGFAGDAFVVAPLTHDSHSLSALVNAMGPDTMPVQGANAAAAIGRSQQLLAAAGAHHGLIVLLTNRANKAAIDAAAAARKAGMRVSVLTLGDKRPLTLKDGSLLHDSHGKLALTDFNNQRLAAIAHAGGGDYVTGSQNNADIKRIEAGLVSGKLQTGRTIQHWKDMGPWLLLPLLLILAISFRRGWLLLLIIVMPLAMPQPAAAASWQQRWDNLWKTPDQQAAQALNQGLPKRAAQLATSPEWRGAGAYQAGHYKQAVAAYRSLDTASGRYNLGNALAKSGDLKGAIKAYQQALKLAPDNADAKTNLERVKARLKQQQKKQQQKAGNKASSGKSKDDQPKSSQGKKPNHQKAPGSADKRTNKGTDKAAQDGRNNGSKKPQPKPNKAQGKPTKASTGQPSSQSPQQATPSSATDANQKTAPKEPAAAQPLSRAQQKANKAATAKATKALAKQLQKPSHKAAVNNLGALPDKGEPSPLSDTSQQLLQSVTDQPGALLQRKFKLQYLQRKAQGEH